MKPASWGLTFPFNKLKGNVILFISAVIQFYFYGTVGNKSCISWLIKFNEMHGHLCNWKKYSSFWIYVKHRNIKMSFLIYHGFIHLFANKGKNLGVGRKKVLFRVPVCTIFLSLFLSCTILSNLCKIELFTWVKYKIKQSRQSFAKLKSYMKKLVIYMHKNDLSKSKWGLFKRPHRIWKTHFKLFQISSKEPS